VGRFAIDVSSTIELNYKRDRQFTGLELSSSGVRFGSYD
jgi:hypothetical protein